MLQLKNMPIIQSSSYYTLLQVQARILQFYADLLPHIYSTINLHISSQQWIHCLIAGHQSSPPLILLHGLGGCAVYFAKMITKLAQSYKVIAIDMPGTGLSSRTPYRPNDLDSAIEYFTERIEKLVVALDVKEKVNLVGHSLGGLIAGYYLERYPERVQSLTLLSPLGCHQLNEDQMRQMKRQFKIRHGFWLGHLKYGAFWLANALRITPSWLVSILNWLKASSYVRQGLALKMSIRDKELDLWTEYFIESGNIGQTSERCFHQFMEFPLIVKKPLEPILRKHSKSIRLKVMYGEKDWMLLSNGEQFKKQLKDSPIANLQMRIIEKGTHQLPFVYSEQVVGCMVEK